MQRFHGQPSSTMLLSSAVCQSYPTQGCSYPSAALMPFPGHGSMATHHLALPPTPSSAAAAAAALVASAGLDPATAMAATYGHHSPAATAAAAVVEHQLQQLHLHLHHQQQQQQQARPGCPCCGGRCERDAREILRGRGANAPEMLHKTSVVCVGDSITAGIGASQGGTTYPEQLQKLLGDSYVVTNLGACGAALQRTADTPYWQRLQWEAAVRVRADLVVIMLGTNDARPPNWQGNNGPAQYEIDAKAMVDCFVRDGRNPLIYMAVPAPFYGTPVPQGAASTSVAVSNAIVQAVVNDTLPRIIPRISESIGLATTPIPVFEALGGRALSHPDWFGDGCHPNDLGYWRLAVAVLAGLGIPPAVPPLQGLVAAAVPTPAPQLLPAGVLGPPPGLPQPPQTMIPTPAPTLIGQGPPPQPQATTPCASSASAVQSSQSAVQVLSGQSGQSIQSTSSNLERKAAAVPAASGQFPHVLPPPVAGGGVVEGVKVHSVHSSSSTRSSVSPTAAAIPLSSQPGHSSSLSHQTGPSLFPAQAANQVGLSSTAASSIPPTLQHARSRSSHVIKKDKTRPNAIRSMSPLRPSPYTLVGRTSPVPWVKAR